MIIKADNPIKATLVLRSLGAQAAIGEILTVTPWQAKELDKEGVGYRVIDPADSAPERWAKSMRTI